MGGFGSLFGVLSLQTWGAYVCVTCVHVCMYICMYACMLCAGAIPSGGWVALGTPLYLGDGSLWVVI